MRATMLYGQGDVRFQERETPITIKPTDAIIRISATCVDGSDLFTDRKANPVAQPKPMGHEYCGTIQAVGNAVTLVKPGQFVTWLVLCIR
jgi:threonine dehydrogenase-like Zn-dependent dehydrogenase